MKTGTGICIVPVPVGDLQVISSYALALGMISQATR
jgi:hypothetical protein